MDPATAIDLLYSILELGNHALARVKTFQEIVSSSNGEIKHDLRIRKCLGSMRMICDVLDTPEFSIEAQDEVSIQLRHNAGDAILRMQTVSFTLRTIIRRCCTNYQQNTLPVTTRAVKECLSIEVIDQYVADLEMCIYNLSCIVALSTSHQLKRLSDQVGYCDVKEHVQTTHEELIEHIVKGNTTVSSVTKLVRRGSAEARKMLHEHQTTLQRQNSGVQKIPGLLERTLSGTGYDTVSKHTTAFPAEFSFPSWFNDGSGVLYMVGKSGSDTWKSTLMKLLSQGQEARHLLQQWMCEEKGRLAIAMIFLLLAAHALLGLFRSLPSPSFSLLQSSSTTRLET